MHKYKHARLDKYECILKIRNWSLRERYTLGLIRRKEP